MVETSTYYESQESIEANQSPNDGDISSPKSYKSQHSIEKAEQEELIRHKEADKFVENALNEGANSPNKEQYINGESIDSNSKLALIDSQISQLQAKINLIEQKNDLSKAEKRERYSLKKEIRQLNTEKLVIKQEQGKQLDKDKAIIDKDTEKAHETIKTKVDKMKILLQYLPEKNTIKNELLGLLEIINTNNYESIKKQFIGILKNPAKLTSVANDLGWPWSKNYENFKASAISFEPNLRLEFDKYEMNIVPSLAKAKLGTDNLSWVNFGDDTLKTTENGITKSYSRSEWRLLEWANGIKVKSDLDPIHEDHIKEIEDSTAKTLEPINKSLNFVSQIIDYLDSAKSAWQEFNEAKDEIKYQNLALYNELWLESKNSYGEIIGALTSKKLELEKQADKIKKKVKEQINDIVKQSVKEAKEKDRLKEIMFKFFESMGIDKFNSKKFEQLIDYINVTPWKYGLQHKIDLDNADLGFDKDFWSAEINSVEKKEFIKLFNHILWENIINENIANGTTTLSPEAVMKIQVLANKPVWYFMENLDKEKN